MNLKKFRVLKEKKDLAPMGDIEETILLNVDQIVSLKPINIQAKGTVIQGFWIRLTNDKKYKATVIPKEILSLFENEISIKEMGKESKVNGNEAYVQ